VVVFQEDTVFHDDTAPHLVYDGANVSDGRPADLTDSTARAPIANANSKEGHDEPQTSLLYGLLALSLVLFGFPFKAFADDSSSAGDAARWAALGGYYTGMYTGPMPSVVGKPLIAGVVGVLGSGYRDSIPHIAKVDVVSNPELLSVQQFGRSFDDLAANPELLSLQQFVRGFGDVVSNPELLSLRQYNICSC
jgi:hypothetical protein